MKAEWKGLLENLAPETVRLRRQLHEHPELSLAEKETSALVRREMEALGLPWEPVGDYGLIGRLECGPGKTVLLRADMDALPVAEEAENLCRPKAAVSRVPGVSHACGHDAHVAMLLTAMKALCAMRESLHGTVLFCFEQAEEVGKGVQPMIEALAKYPVDTAWAIHVYAGLDSGRISVDAGPRMAGLAAYTVRLTGKGGHISRPDLCHNPILCGAQIFSNLGMLWATGIDPTKTVTLGVGTFHAGEKGNVIPDTAEFAGSLRFFDKEEGLRAYGEFKRTVETTAGLCHCQAEFTRELVAPFVVRNDPASAARAARAVEEWAGPGHLSPCEPWSATESMAVYLEKYPGVLAFLGIRNPVAGTGAGHHTTRFDVDDDALAVGVAATVGYTWQYLEEE